ncbi:MAG: glycosyltransferase family 39 protein, partial [Candidatus Brocadiae bacterium]|nr:glycosyltransferase family 39 protein [Candidatus Brocadiia bacterium]
MAGSEGGGGRPWAAPTAVFCVAFAVRLAVAIEAWNRIPFLKSPVIDGAEYGIRARQVMSGEFWPARLEIHPPLYGWALGAVYALFGEGGFAPFLLQALAGAGTAVLLWRFTRALAGPAAGLAAGMLA